MEYKVVAAVSARLLTQLVQIEIDSGWKLYGNMVIYYYGAEDKSPTFYQPMTKD